VQIEEAGTRLSLQKRGEFGPYRTRGSAAGIPARLSTSINENTLGDWKNYLLRPGMSRCVELESSDGTTRWWHRGAGESVTGAGRSSAANPRRSGSGLGE
jgi:hypothetical protein